jgi:excisionase family DNA binding protein
MTTTKPKKLTTSQVATLFGVDERTVRRWDDEGKLHAVRTLGGARRFDVDEVERLTGLEVTP